MIDYVGMPDDGEFARYFQLGCEVKALGRGHVQRIKQAVCEKAPMAPAHEA